MEKRATKRCGPRRRSRRVVAATALVALLLVAACSGSEEPAGSPPDPLKSPADTSAGQGQASSVKLTSATGTVTGKLPSSGRAEATKAVSGLVDQWFSAAYLDGPYPRRDFTGSWPGFSPGLAARAKSERTVTSNAGIGPRIDGVRAEKRSVTVDLLVVDGAPVGATANVHLVFVTSGEVRRRVTVMGKVYLSPRKGSWYAFGYDLARSDAALPTASPTGGTR